MKVSDIMKRDFISVGADTDVLSLAKQFMNSRDDCALVVAADGSLSGIVTETDLIFQEKKLHIPTFFTFLDSFIFLENLSSFNEELRKMAAATAGDIMSRDVRTVAADGDVSDAATVMIEKDIHHLPVVDGGKPVGLVTKECLLKAFIAERESR